MLKARQQIQWGLREKWLLAYAVMVMIVAGTMATGLYFRLRQDQRTALQERLLDIVNFSAPLVDGDFHALIRTPGDQESSFYRVVFLRLEGIQDTSTIIRRIYTLRQDDEGAIVYIVDANPVSAAGVGDPFPRNSDTLRGMWGDLTFPVIEDELHSDENGISLSGYAPIYDQFQNLDGVLGIDIDASGVIASEKQARQTALVAFVGTVPISFLAGWWLVTVLTLPVKDLMHGAVRVAQGELIGEVPIRSRDELGVLATAFNAMTAQLRQTLQGLEHEIEEHKRAERVQDAIYQISQAAISNDSMDELYRSIHEILKGLMPAENFFIALYNASLNLIDFPYSVDEYDNDLPVISPGQGLTAYVLRTGQSLLLTPDGFDRFIAEGEVELIGTRPVDWLGAPLRVEGEIIGVMATQVYTDEIRYTEGDLELFEFVSTQVALAIERKHTETELQASNQRYQNLFEESPISLWEEDFSVVKRMLDALKTQGVTDFAAYMREHPGFVAECAQRVKVLDVNKATLSLYQARNKAQLLNNLALVFVEDSYHNFQQELVNIALGKMAFNREGINCALDGTRMDVSINWSVVPGFSHDLSRVIISVIDITERKQVEQRIRYLGTHDAMTGLYNRAHFDGEMSRLELEGQYPVSIIVADLDKLKQTNDTLGHAVGDELLRQAARVLQKSFRTEDVVARIGGDEFGVLMQNSNEGCATIALERIRENLRNQTVFSDGIRVELSLGVNTAGTSDELFDVFKQADRNMYAEKQRKAQNSPE